MVIEVDGMISINVICVRVWLKHICIRKVSLFVLNAHRSSIPHARMLESYGRYIWWRAITIVSKFNWVNFRHSHLYAKWTDDYSAVWNFFWRIISHTEWVQLKIIYIYISILFAFPSIHMVVFMAYSTFDTDASLRWYYIKLWLLVLLSLLICENRSLTLYILNYRE